MNAQSLKAAIEAMPPEVQKELEGMRSANRGVFGNTKTQTIVDRHLGLLLWLRNEHQADHSDLALLLHLHGISRSDGQPLTVGTLSSAISRAIRANKSATTQVASENPVTTEDRLGPKRSAQPRAAAPRPARRHPALGAEVSGLGSTAASAPAQMPIALEPLALTPVTEAPVRCPEAPEIRRADYARLMLIDPTQED